MNRHPCTLRPRLRLALVAVALAWTFAPRIHANGTIDTSDSQVAAGAAPQPGAVTVEPCVVPGTAPAMPQLGTLGTLGTITASIPAFPGGGTGALGAFHATSDTELLGGTYEYTSFSVDTAVTLRYLGPVTIRTTGDVNIDGIVIVDSGAAIFECAGNLTVSAISAIPVAGVQTFGGLIKFDVDGVLRFVDKSPGTDQATSAFGTQGKGDVDFIARGGATGAAFEFGHCNLFGRRVTMRSATDLVVDGSAIYAFEGAGTFLHALGGDFEIRSSAIDAVGPIEIEASGAVIGSKGYLLAREADTAITAFGGSVDLTSGQLHSLGNGNIRCRASAGVALRDGADISVVDEFGAIEVTAFGGDLTIQSGAASPYNLLKNDGVGSTSLAASGAVLVDGGALVKVTQGDLTVRAFGGDLTCTGVVTVDNLAGPVDIGALGDVTATTGGDIKVLGSSLHVFGERLDLTAQLLARTGAVTLKARGALAGTGTMEAAAQFGATSIDGDVTFDGAGITTSSGAGARSGDIRIETFAGARSGRIAARHALLKSGDHAVASGDVVLRVVTIPRPTVRAFLLPSSVSLKLGAVRGAGMKVSGTIGCPSAWLTPGDPAPLPFVLDVGARQVAGDLALRPNGRDREFKAQGVLLRVSPSRTGTSRGVFTLQLTEDLTGKVPADGLVDLSLKLGAAEFEGTVRLVGGKFKLGSVRGAVSELLYPLAVTAQSKGGGKDSLAFTMGFASDGVTPPAMPELGIEFGDGYAATIAASDFTRSGDRFIAKNPPSAPGLTLVVVDFDEETVTVKGKNLDLGALPAGSPVASRVVVAFAGDIRSVELALSRSGTKLAY